MSYGKVYTVSEEDVEWVDLGKHIARKKLLIMGQNVSLAVVETPKGRKFKLKKHPEEEIVYVLHGKVEYHDGRVVEERMATYNPPNVLHGGSTPQRLLAIEVKSPPDHELYEKMKKLKLKI